MKSGIYKITNNITKQCYIGASNNIKNRFCMHKNNSSNKKLNKDIIDYGINNFSIDIIEECDLYQLKERENHYIKLYNLNHNLYNTSDKSSYINKDTIHSQKNNIEFEHINTYLVRQECKKQGITKPKKQDLVNCAFVLANQKLNELIK